MSAAMITIKIIIFCFKERKLVDFSTSSIRVFSSSETFDYGAVGGGVIFCVIFVDEGSFVSTLFSFFTTYGFFNSGSLDF